MLFATLKSNSLGVYEQITKGIKSTTNVIDLKNYITNCYADGKWENIEQIVGNYKEVLPQKNSFNQREKSMIMQDFVEILKNEELPERVKESARGHQEKKYRYFSFEESLRWGLGD
jgi:type III secretory pathway lipoprotein EscJ